MVKRYGPEHGTESGYEQPAVLLRSGEEWLLKEWSYPIGCELMLVALYRQKSVVVCCNGNPR